MHDIDIDMVEMTLDVVKYAINRITQTNPELGKPKTEAELRRLVGETVTNSGIGGEKAFELFRQVLVKATVPIDHPRHLAFVPASPTRAAILFDLVTSASSIHGAYWMEGAGGIFCENEAMKWLVSLTGMPEPAFGVFTSGGTAANLSAIVVAREKWRKNPRNINHKGILITSIGAHSSIKAMAKVIDADVLLVASEDAMSQLALEAFYNKLPETEKARVFAVVATGGTTNAGIIDELDGIANFCRSKNLWFHVDAAYGGGALAAKSVRHLFKGIELADSVTIDPHKWLFSPYDCGAVIYKNPEEAKEAHAQEGSYLEIFKDEGAHGFNPSDYQIQLTRRLRGLPLWFSLATHGTEKYEWAVEQGIKLAKIAGELIEKNPLTELVREPSLSCVLYRRIGWSADDYRNWTYRNHEAGFALVTPTKWKSAKGYETVSRFCFINPDTMQKDIEDILKSME
ncbi:aminotransferase class V-fold PLP-dependent enzyme [Maribacter algicola]|uniref:Aminotransferase class V-fold PLP-dependent enzyme n=1 Tax=Maribacter algicola TaxID=2498892 RepID=A0A3R8RXF7_9FLAO|nr:aminotransferase class V-fold PLP-dependent enzyme [Maribacter algicola]RRQ47605.1 aminotransferase class V-fold PLP-dependent enzyme [Maribacter algicola]